MTTIRTTCKRCGDVELTTGDIGLELAADDSTGNYRFSCPSCGVIQRKLGIITEDEIAAFARALDEGGWHSELTSS